MTIYLTRWALTSGIIKCEVEPPTDGAVFVGHYNLYRKPDWHETLEEAIAQAEVVRLKAIEQSKKRIVKLTNLKIKLPT